MVDPAGRDWNAPVIIFTEAYETMFSIRGWGEDGEAVVAVKDVDHGEADMADGEEEVRR